MSRVYTLIELTSLVGDERLYIVSDPTGTPVDRYVDIATLDARWGSYFGTLSVNEVADAGATETLTLHDMQVVTMTENCDITFPTVTGGHGFILILDGEFVPTLPGTVEWADGTPPDYDSKSWFTFITHDGTYWVGTLVASGLS